MRVTRNTKFMAFKRLVGGKDDILGDNSGQKVRTSFCFQVTIKFAWSYERSARPA